MAIGVRRSDVVLMIMRQSGAVILSGCIIGLAGSYAFVRVMQSLLYGVGPADSRTIVGHSVLFSR